jgi:hypothetical protein
MTILLIVVAVLISILLFFRFLTRLTKRTNKKTPNEIAGIIEHFLDGTGGPWDWDDFISCPIYNDSLDLYRLGAQPHQVSFQQRRAIAMRTA